MKEYKNYLFDLYGTLVDIHTDEEDDLLWKRMSVLLAMNGVFYTADALKEKYVSEITRRETQARKERGNGGN